jgi:hypothetical protein
MAAFFLGRTYKTSSEAKVLREELDAVRIKLETSRAGILPTENPRIDARRKTIKWNLEKELSARIAKLLTILKLPTKDDGSVRHLDLLRSDIKAHDDNITLCRPVIISSITSEMKTNTKIKKYVLTVSKITGSIILIDKETLEFKYTYLVPIEAESLEDAIDMSWFLLKTVIKN